MAEMKVLSHEADSLRGEFGQRVNAKKRRLTDLAAEILRELKPDSELNPRVATFALFGMINWVYTWYKPGRDVPLDRLVEELMQLFLHGYLAEHVAAEASGVGGNGIGNSN
jgi:TetR/AcrR family transcriptional regulator